MTWVNSLNSLFAEVRIAALGGPSIANRFNRRSVVQNRHCQEAPSQKDMNESSRNHSSCFLLVRDAPSPLPSKAPVVNQSPISGYGKGGAGRTVSFAFVKICHWTVGPLPKIVLTRDPRTDDGRGPTLSVKPTFNRVFLSISSHFPLFLLLPSTLASAKSTC